MVGFGGHGRSGGRHARDGQVAIELGLGLPVPPGRRLHFQAGPSVALGVMVGSRRQRARLT